ncbi:MAG: hypothetical protein ACOYOL_05955 [Chthoniobacterales bacterium]
MPTKSLLARIAAVALVCAPSLHAAPFANGDLLMSFQATSGDGSSSTLVVNLGPAYVFRNATSDQANVANIGSLLTSTYGASTNWYARPELFFCLNANRQAGFNPAPPPAGNQGSPVVNGDARNAVYVGSGKSDGNAGTYDQFTVTPSALNTTGTDMQSYNATVTTPLASSDSAVIPTSVNLTIEDFTTPAGVLLVNFLSFPANFNQAFGAGVRFSKGGVDYVGALTLQRLNRTDATSGSLAGNVVVPGIAAGSGSNEGFFAIRANGQIDYFAPTGGGGTPTLTANPTTLSGYATTTGTASTAQTFTVSGSNLTADATITAPASFEVSTDGTTFSPSVSLTQSGGTIPLSTIYVRIAASAGAGSPSGNVTVASTGATTQNVAVSGTVNSLYGGWAIGYGLDPLVTTGPTAGAMSGDPDNDGFNNAAEFTFGTIPTLGNAALVSTVKSGSNVLLTYLQRNSGLTTPYVLNSRTSLSSGSWANSGVTPTTAGSQAGVPSGYTRMQFSVPVVTGSRFYQVAGTQ